MKVTSENQLVDLVIEWIRQNHSNSDSNTIEITESTDLIATGLLDSFGFINLIMFIETEAGCKIDLSDIDPNEFTIVKGLCKYAIENRQ